MKFWKKLPKNQSKFEEIKGISTIDDLCTLTYLPTVHDSFVPLVNP